jgi:hypothetical protein
MRALLAGALLIATVACGSRKVDVSTAPKAAAAVTLHFTNNDNSAVNVYVVQEGTDHFVKQVRANSTEDLPVANIPAGTEVRFKATRTDSSKTYTSDPMALNATTTWQVP